MNLQSKRDRLVTPMLFFERWRSVNAKGYMFIHCLWTNGKKHQHQGLGRLLINEVEKDAYDMLGVAIITSDKAFMANKNIFLKNEYKGVDDCLLKTVSVGCTFHRRI